MNAISQQQKEMNIPIRRVQRSSLPCGDLIERRVDYINMCVPLYNASIKGDWEAAKIILDQRPELVRFGISENYDTTLHIAASAKPTKSVENFVENLVNLMTSEELELRNKDRNTALCIAATAGNVKIVMTMVNKHRTLVDIPGGQDMMPLYMACLFGQREMVRYLYGNSKKMTGDFWTNENRARVLHSCVEADLFDIALRIVTDRPELANTTSVLGVLARETDACSEIKPHILPRVIFPTFTKVRFANKPSDAMKLLRIIWTKTLTLSNAEIVNIIRGPIKIRGAVQRHSSNILFVAAKMGNSEFLVELIRQYPDLLWKINHKNQSIFHVAVKYRHVDIYNLLYEIGSMKDMILSLKDTEGNNMLHLVGKRPKKKRLGDTSGVALQMQRELLWFKEVEAMVPSSYRERKNNACKTPSNLFSDEHGQLFREGEMWVKETAGQSMVVSALIATIAFAVAFTVPGGYNQDNGIPMFYNKRNFIVFAVADAISFIFSSISILIFLFVHITSYFKQDLLDSLPKVLISGLATLSVSIIAMMVAFSISFFVLYHNNLIWIPIVISVFASIPVILLAKLHHPLLMAVFHTTYASKNLFKPIKPRLYIQNPKF